jgi:enamine deaminase RidA (YjgF/YER057c/UK114 family)
METRLINPLELGADRHSHVAVAPAGRTIFVSGQIAYDGTGRIVGKAIRAQAMRGVREPLRRAPRPTRRSATW